jgi:ubiquitin C-terminal hydrolase
MHQKVIKLKELSNDHIGLINEGMTCYMNSMIQSLNVLGYFKRGIFSMPYDNTERSLSYSLQRLFYDLTFEKEAASTNRLVQSFGWSADDILVQHDVQEFNMMLSDLMEKKLKGTNNEEVFKYLFEGKIRSKIECVDYQYESIKEEKFDDLQLNVKGCNNIYDSFDKYTEKEVLDGDDKYEVEGHGKEKAIKSTTFSKFPPVLILQLKRFEYNPKVGSMEKVNDHFEFYETIDLTKYLNNDSSSSNKYKLLSVVVHKGNIYGGHYYAYTRFDVTKNEWYCFNDKIVHKADLYEVFDINYGGDYSAVIYKHDTNSVSKISVKSDLSAYILIYIESSKAQEILKPIHIDEVPSELITQIKRDKLEEKLQSMLQVRDINMINVYYLNEYMLKQYHGLGIGKGIPRNNNNNNITSSLMDVNKKTYKEESLLTSYFVIPRSTTVPELYSICTYITGISFKEISMFLVIFNNTIKPQNTCFTMHFLDYHQHAQMPIENIARELSERNKRPRRLVIYFEHSSMKQHEPIIQQYPPYDPSSFTISEHNLLDEKKINISETISIYVPNSNPFIMNYLHPKCVKYERYTRKLLIYKVLNISNSFNILRTVSICVDERGRIENSSIKLMKEIENEIMNYYMKEYNISNETMDHIETLGIAYFADTRCLKFMNGILECIPNENKYDMTCCDIAFDLKFIERSFLCYMNDFNQTLFYNKYSDCLIVIPVLYRGTQLVGLNEFVNKFNESNNSNSNSQQTNKVNQHYSQ